MDSVRKISPKWSSAVAFAVMLSALSALPALAGDLVLRHEVSSGTVTSAGVVGPAGPHCNGTTDFSACTFSTSTSTSTGKDDPGGPFTSTTTTTLYFGLDGFAYTVNGAANPDGTFAGACLPYFSTSHTVYANGTIDKNGTGSVCCAGTSCGPSGLGPPTVSHGTSTCISGTGKYAGIQCSSEETSTNSDSVHFIVRSESVSTK